MTFRRMLPFLLLNIIVSAAVVLGILFWWDSRQPETEPAAVAAATVAMALPEPAQPGAAAVEESAPPAEESGGDGPLLHTVQAGDTLGRISDTYDVSMQDIMEANGIDNPDLLSVGQQLVIPIGGIPVATATVEATVALPSPIPTEQIAAEGAADIEIAGVEATGVLAEEAVQIVNNGSDPQTMQGWKIRDEDNNVYTFGQISIFGEGAGVRLHSRTGSDTAIDLFWGLEEPAWRSGELLTLWDAADQVVVSYTVP